jgi:hypothetical protein
MPLAHQRSFIPFLPSMRATKTNYLQNLVEIFTQIILYIFYMLFWINNQIHDNFDSKDKIDAESIMHKFQIFKTFKIYIKKGMEIVQYFFLFPICLIQIYPSTRKIGGLWYGWLSCCCCCCGGCEVLTNNCTVFVGVPMPIHWKMTRR